MKKSVNTISIKRRSILVIILLTALPALFLLAASPVRAEDGVAIVVGVDYPEGCLRIRSGPSSSTPIIGCADRGSRLRLTGRWIGEWAEISRPILGWVYGPQISWDSDSAVSSTVVITPPAVEYVPYPIYSYPYRFYRYWSHSRPYRGFKHRRGVHKYRHYPGKHREYRYRHRRGSSSPRIYSTRSGGRRAFIGRSSRSSVTGFRRGSTFRGGSTFRRGSSLRGGSTFLRGSTGRTGATFRRGMRAQRGATMRRGATMSIGGGRRGRGRR